jgi:TonB family protein
VNPAAQSLLRPRPSGLLPFMLGSVGAHLLVVAAGLVLSWALAGPRLNVDVKPIKASLVRLGKPRDPKLLPTKPEEAAPPPAKPDPVAVAPAAAPDNVVKLPSKDAAATKPAKDAKAEPAKDPRKSLFDAINRTSRPAREAEGALDGDPDGDSAVQEGERYDALLASVVKKNYDVSNTIPEAERRTLLAQVTLRIGASGEVLDVKLSKSSGNALFDDAVLAAVKNASPFTPPPPHLRDSLKKDGRAFVFRP